MTGDQGCCMHKKVEHSDIEKLKYVMKGLQDNHSTIHHDTINCNVMIATYHEK